MFEYKFVKVKLNWFSASPKEDYKEVVKEHAQQGWRLVQIFAPGTSMEGRASYFELIFEKRID